MSVSIYYLEASQQPVEHSVQELWLLVHLLRQLPHQPQPHVPHSHVRRRRHRQHALQHLKQMIFEFPTKMNIVQNSTWGTTSFSEGRIILATAAMTKSAASATSHCPEAASLLRYSNILRKTLAEPTMKTTSLTNSTQRWRNSLKSLPSSSTSSASGSICRSWMDMGLIMGNHQVIMAVLLPDNAWRGRR